MRSVVLSLFLALNWLHLTGQDYQIKWDLSLGTTGDETLSDVIAISHNKFLFVAGTRDSFGYTDYYIIKTDDSGIVEWEKTFGGDEFDFLNAAIETADGGFLLGGYSRSFTSTPNDPIGQFDIWLIKVNEEGEAEWEKFYGGSGYDILRGMIANGAGYLFLGSTASDDGDVSVNRGLYDAWAVQIDQTGNIIWEKTFGGSDKESFYSAIMIDDKHILFAGNTESRDGMISNHYGYSDAWVVCTDANGQLLWEKTFGGSATDQVGYKSIKQSNDGNFLLFGYSASDDHNLQDYSGEENGWVWKINSEGELLWSYAAGHENPESVSDVKEIGENKLFLLGVRATLSDPFAAANYWIVTIDETNGSIQNEQMFGGFPDDWGLRILENSDGDIILAGVSNSDDGDITHKIGMEDIWLACIELRPVTISTVEESPTIKIYPNPVTDRILIGVPENFIFTAELFDEQGRLLISNISSPVINIENIPGGLYFLKILDSNSGIEKKATFIKAD